MQPAQYHTYSLHYSTVFPWFKAESCVSKPQRWDAPSQDPHTSSLQYWHFLFLLDRTSKSRYWDRISRRKLYCFWVCWVLWCICLSNFTCSGRLTTKVPHHRFATSNFFSSSRKCSQLCRSCATAKSTISKSTSIVECSRCRRSTSALSDSTTSAACPGSLSSCCKSHLLSPGDGFAGPQGSKSSRRSWIISQQEHWSELQKGSGTKVGIFRTSVLGRSELWWIVFCRTKI